MRCARDITHDAQGTHTTQLQLQLTARSAPGCAPARVPLVCGHTAGWGKFSKSTPQNITIATRVLSSLFYPAGHNLTSNEEPHPHPVSLIGLSLITNACEGAHPLASCFAALRGARARAAGA